MDGHETWRNHGWTTRWILAEDGRTYVARKTMIEELEEPFDFSDVSNVYLREKGHDNAIYYNAISYKLNVIANHLKAEIKRIYSLQTQTKWEDTARHMNLLLTYLDLSNAISPQNSLDELEIKDVTTIYTALQSYSSRHTHSYYLHYVQRVRNVISHKPQIGLLSFSCFETLTLDLNQVCDYYGIPHEEKLIEQAVQILKGTSAEIDKAIELLYNARKMNPQSAATCYLLCNAFVKSDVPDYAKAKKWIDCALELSPCCPVIKKQAGEVHEALGHYSNYSMAQYYYEQVRELSSRICPLCDDDKSRNQPCYFYFDSTPYCGNVIGSKHEALAAYLDFRFKILRSKMMIQDVLELNSDLKEKPKGLIRAMNKKLMNLKMYDLPPEECISYGNYFRYLKDFKEARRWYETQPNNPDADLSIGIMKLHGWGLPEDLLGAVQLISNAACKPLINSFTNGFSRSVSDARCIMDIFVKEQLGIYFQPVIEWSDKRCQLYDPPDLPPTANGTGRESENTQGRVKKKQQLIQCKENVRPPSTAKVPETDYFTIPAVPEQDSKSSLTRQIINTDRTSKKLRGKKKGKKPCLGRMKNLLPPALPETVAEPPKGQDSRTCTSIPEQVKPFIDTPYSCSVARSSATGSETIDAQIPKVSMLLQKDCKPAKVQSNESSLPLQSVAVSYFKSALILQLEQHYRKALEYLKQAAKYGYSKCEIIFWERIVYCKIIVAEFIERLPFIGDFADYLSNNPELEHCMESSHYLLKGHHYLKKKRYQLAESNYKQSLVDHPEAELTLSIAEFLGGIKENVNDFVVSLKKIIRTFSKIGIDSNVNEKEYNFIDIEARRILEIMDELNLCYFKPVPVFKGG